MVPEIDVILYDTIKKDALECIEPLGKGFVQELKYITTVMVLYKNKNATQN